MDFLPKSSCYDVPDKRDILFEDVFGAGEENEKKAAPFPKITMFNQGSSAACTRYALRMLNNGQNINEYEKNGMIYKELDPMEPRLRYCKEDPSAISAGATLQSANKQAVDDGIIEGYAKIATKAATILCIKTKGRFISSGSGHGDWAKIRDTGVWTRRKDDIFVGHAHCVTDCDDKGVYGPNSYGDNRGPNGGYFFTSRDDYLSEFFTKYAIIDKDDSGKFLEAKKKAKASQAIKLLGDIWNMEVDKNRPELNHMATDLRKMYSVK